MSKISEKVAAFAQPAVEALGLELWDVEYVREAGKNYLRVYIDKADGEICIEDCERVNAVLDPLLDEYDPIPTSYTFEVSSAGAERQLKRPGDFERFLGSKVEVKLYSPKNGRKAIQGKLLAYEDGNVTVEENGKPVTLTKSETAGVRLMIEF